MRYTLLGERRVKHQATGQTAYRWTMVLIDPPNDISELWDGRKYTLGWTEGKTDKDRMEADKVAKEHIYALRQKYNIGADPGVALTFSDLVPMYLANCATRGSDKKGRNKGAIEKWMIPFFKDRPLEQLKPQDGDAWVKWYREQLSKKGKPLSVGSLDRDRRILRTLINYAVDCEYMTKNPFRKLKTPKGKERKRPLSVDELIVLGPHMTRQLKAATLAGIMIMQRQEIIYDICREHIVRYPSGYVVNLRESHTETKLNVETMPLNRISLAALSWENPAPISGRIFHTWRDPNGLSKEFSKAVKRARIPHAVYHDLRHTAGTALQKAKFNPLAIEKLLGHSLGGVIGRYQHGWDDEYREAVDILEKAYKPVAEAYGFSLAGLADVSQVSKQLLVHSVSS
jgi:integrase